MENKRLKIGILGLGLIGGSILKALHDLNKYSLYAVSKSSSDKAKEYCEVSSSDINILSDCNVVFVCSRMDVAQRDLNSLNGVVRNDTIVTDVCSIKGFLKSDYKYNYIPSHPMAGTEFSGSKNSFAELFAGAKWVMMKENETLRNLIIEMGAKPLIMSANVHDASAAEISHLPMLLSMALFNFAKDESKKIASSGFRDTTRLAMTNADLAADMLKFNRENIISSYKKFAMEFERLLGLNEEEFKKEVAIIAQKRANMYDENGKNKF